MLTALLHPTPKQLYHLTIAYVVLASVLSFFLAGWLIALMGVFGGLQIIASVKKLSEQDKVRDKQKSKKDWLVYFSIPFAIIFYLVFYSGVLFREDFVLYKDGLAKTSGVIPEHSTRVETGSGKSRRTRYYLTINDVNLHCSEDDYDDCERIYTHKGQIATVYYQPNTKNGNLAYEIVVNHTPIYRFDAQLTAFQAERNKENLRFFWAFILYVLPAFYFVFIHRNAVEHIEEMDEDEKAAHDTQNELNNLKEQLASLQKARISIKDYGCFGFLIYVFGLICLAIAIILLIIMFFAGTITSFMLFAIFTIVGGVCTYFPRQNAKLYRDERLDEVRSEIQDKINALSPSPKPTPSIVTANTTPAKPPVLPTAPVMPAPTDPKVSNTTTYISNPTNSPAKHPITHADQSFTTPAWHEPSFDRPVANQSSTHQPAIHRAQLPTTHPKQNPYTDPHPTPAKPHHIDTKDDEEAYEAYEEALEWEILTDFGILGLSVFILGLSVILINIVLSLSSSVDKSHPYFWWFTAMFVVGGAIMMYKTYANAKFNKEIRAGLYDDEEWEDEDEELSFVYRLFRILVFLVLVPLFLLRLYDLLFMIINFKALQVVSVLFLLVMIGYPLKKLWAGEPIYNQVVFWICLILSPCLLFIG